MSQRPSDAQILSLLAHALGIDFKKLHLSFGQRKSFQKSVYFLQRAFDMNMGFGYNLYLYGPYSPALAEASYKISEQCVDCKRFVQANRLADEFRQKVSQFNSFVKSGMKRVSLRKADFLEVAATLHYLWRAYSTMGNLEEKKKKVIKRCQEMKQWTKPKEVQEVFNALRSRHILEQ